MTPQGFEVYGRSRTSKNAWRVVQIVRERVDDVPVFGDFITALLAEKNEGANFFFSIKETSRNTKIQPKTKNQMSLEAAISRRFLSSSRGIIKLDNFLWRTCTATVLPKPENIVLFVLVLIKVFYESSANETYSAARTRSRKSLPF